MRHLVAVQSQDFVPARWSVGDRLRSGTDASVAQAFDDGELLRTHVLRPTWHFVLPEDIRWMLELTSPRVLQVTAGYNRRLGLDPKLLTRTDRLIAKALTGGRYLTRPELKDVLARAGVDLDVQPLGHVVMNAELNGLICSGPLRGKQHTYALLEERAPDARRLSRDEALHELALRYFTSHGPATAKDFQWWSSLTLTEIRRTMAGLGDALEQDTLDGVTYWYDTSVAGARLASPTVHLLHGYDEFVVGYTESKPMLHRSDRRFVYSLGQASYNGLVLVDGRVAGRWKRTSTSAKTIAEVALDVPFDETERHALDAAIRRYERFVERPVELRVICS